MIQKLTPEHVAECRKIIREGSKSFYFASLLLPSHIRMSATALYAFCRVSDDIADAPGSDMDAVNRLRDRLECAYQGKPYNHAADHAFAEVVAQYEIPKLVPLSMIEGFEWDVTHKTYENLSDVIDYSARVAGTVGIMMSMLMGRRERATLARACDLGLAMQLINIARDVGEDARNGRVYLPADWLKEAGVDREALLENPEFTPQLGSVVERLLNKADEIYIRSLTGIADLPAKCRPGIRAAALVYNEIGHRVRANGFNSIDNRAYTTRARKLALMLKVPGKPFDIISCDQSEPLPEVTYLVDAAQKDHDLPSGDAEWVVDLFTRMKEQDNMFLADAKSQRSRHNIIS